jgi:hypothetical protein
VDEIPGELIRRLHELPPEQFIAARDDEVARARREGDRDRAAAIGRLRRPTLAAWLVNLLAIQRPDELAELLDLGRALRDAQHELQGEELRRLSGQRRVAISGLVAQARRLALANGRSPRDNLPLAEVEATLSAALSDREVAEAVQAGRLTKATDYAGFGEPPRPRLRVIDGGAGSGGTQRSAAREPVAKEQPTVGKSPGRRVAGGSPDTSGEAVEPAAERTAAKAARAELRQATADEKEAARNLSELGRQLDELRERHAAAQIAVRAARLRRRQAERAVERTERKR